MTYIVDASGVVEPSSIRIVSSDYPAFADAVLAAVGNARFTPGRVHGRVLPLKLLQGVQQGPQLQAVIAQGVQRAAPRHHAAALHLVQPALQGGGERAEGGL